MQWKVNFIDPCHLMPQIRLTNSSTNKYSWELNTKQTVNSYLRSALLWDTTKCLVVLPSGHFRTTYWSHLSAVKISWFLKMGPIGCTKTQVRNYHHMLHNIPQECRSHLLCSRSLELLLLIYFMLWYYPSVLNSFMIIQAAYKYSCPDF